MNNTVTDEDIADFGRSLRVTRDVVRFFHQQAEHNSLMDDFDCTYFAEKYWLALTDKENQLELKIQGGCLALIFTMAMCEAGNIAVCLHEAIPECVESLQMFNPEDKEINKLKELTLQALTWAAIPAERRDVDAIIDYASNYEWVRQTFVQPYFKNRSTIGKRPTAKCGKWALSIFAAIFALPAGCFLASEIFRIGSLNLGFCALFIMIFGGLPGCFVTLVLGTVGIIRNEHPIEPALFSVGLSVLPVLFGLWVLKNYITMGEPW